MANEVTLIFLILDYPTCHAFSTMSHLERFSTRTIYDLLFSRIVDYSKDFHTIQSPTISQICQILLGKWESPNDQQRQRNLLPCIPSKYSKFQLSYKAQTQHDGNVAGRHDMQQRTTTTQGDGVFEEQR